MVDPEDEVPNGEDIFLPDIESKASLSNADLVRKDLSNAELSGKDLSNADLSASDLSGADLSGADLSGAKLTAANLSRTNLKNADLSEADLSTAYLPNVDLKRADLKGANLKETNFVNADLSGANLTDSNLKNASLSEANLSGANLTDARLNGANLIHTNVSGDDLSGADLSGANFSLTDLKGIDLSGEDLSDGEFRLANLRSADLSGADLSGADLSGANLKGADLSGADLSGADLSDSDLFKTNLTDAEIDDAIIDTDTESARFGYDWVTPDTNLGDALSPTPYTPHTYWQLPKGDTEVYFCYFTTRRYKKDDSKYRLLHEELVKRGAFAEEQTVIEAERDSMPNPLWDSIRRELNIENFPALLVCQTSLEFESVKPTDTNFDCPNDTDFVKLEQGVISDNILNSSDDINDFLNDLHEGGKQNELEQTMNSLIAKEWLTIAKDKLESLLLNTSVLTQ